MRWPAWSQAERSLAPSGSSTRMPQTKRAALMFRAAMAFKRRVFASGQRRVAPRFKAGSSIVRASWGLAGAEEVRGAKNSRWRNGGRPRESSGEQEKADAVLRADERNLRRFIV